MKKKVLSLLLAGTLAASLCACGAAKEAEKKDTESKVVASLETDADKPAKAKTEEKSEDKEKPSEEAKQQEDKPAAEKAAYQNPTERKIMPTTEKAPLAQPTKQYVDWDKPFEKSGGEWTDFFYYTYPDMEMKANTWLCSIIKSADPNEDAMLDALADALGDGWNRSRSWVINDNWGIRMGFMDVSDTKATLMIQGDIDNWDVVCQYAGVTMPKGLVEDALAQKAMLEEKNEGRDHTLNVFQNSESNAWYFTTAMDDRGDGIGEICFNIGINGNGEPADKNAAPTKVTKDFNKSLVWETTDWTHAKDIDDISENGTSNVSFSYNAGRLWHDDTELTKGIQDAANYTEAVAFMKKWLGPEYEESYSEHFSASDGNYCGLMEYDDNVEISWSCNLDTLESMKKAIGVEIPQDTIETWKQILMDYDSLYVGFSNLNDASLYVSHTPEEGPHFSVTIHIPTKYQKQ